MTRYAIMLLAVLVGAAIGILLARRGRKSETTLVEDKPAISLIPWAAGIAVLVIGLFLLADHERSPKDADYKPATIEGGEIKPGKFNQPESQ